MKKIVILLLISIIIILLFLIIRKKKVGKDKIFGLFKVSEPNPYHLLGNGLLQFLNQISTLLKNHEISFTLFSGCGNGTIDSIPVCDNISFSGAYEVGGVAVCESARGTCIAACALSDPICAACMITPFSCNSVCSDKYNPCTRECDKGRNKCINDLKGRWSATINSLLGLGNMKFSKMDNFATVRDIKGQNGELSQSTVSFDIHGAFESPGFAVNASIETSITPKHTGNISLGNLSFILHTTMDFNCQTRTIEKITITGIEVGNFSIKFENSAVYNYIVNFMGIIKDIVYKALLSNLPSVFTNLLTQITPRFTSPVGCFELKDCFMGTDTVKSVKGRVTFDECKAICQNTSDCNYASLSSTGRCSIINSIKGMVPGTQGERSWDKRENKVVQGLYAQNSLAHWNGTLRDISQPQDLCRRLDECVGIGGDGKFYKSGIVEKRYDTRGCDVKVK